MLVKFVCLSTEIFFFLFQMRTKVGRDYQGAGAWFICCAWVGLGVCLMDRCVCVQECPFDLFGWVFFVCVVMYQFVLHTWHWDLHGYSSVCLVSVRWFLLILDHVSYIL